MVKAYLSIMIRMGLPAGLGKLGHAKGEHVKGIVFSKDLIGDYLARLVGLVFFYYCHIDSELVPKSDYLGSLQVRCVLSKRE